MFPVAVARHDDAVRQRCDLIGEAPAIDRRKRALMAAQRKGILFLSRDLVLARMVLGDEPGAQVDVRIAFDERGVRRDLVASHRHHAHRLGAAGDHCVREAAHDALAGIGNRLQAGRTKAIDRHSRCADGNAGAKARDARDVQPLLGLRHRAAEDDVFDVGRLDVWRLAQRFGNHRCRHLVGSHGLERAIGGAPDRRPCR